MVLLHNFLHKNKSSKKNLNVDLVIRTRIAEVKNFKRLNDTFEDTVISLFEKFFINPYQPVKELLGEYPTQFDREMISFFDRKKKSSEQDDVFNSITPIFSTYVKNGLLNEAQELWKRVLIPVYEWEKKTRKRIHKGSIFYFWAQPAILIGDIDAGFFLVHQAIVEDKKTNITTFTKSPAYKTATLNYLDKGQYLYNFVIKWRDFLNSFLLTYNNTYNKNLSLEDFNKRFLSNTSIIESVYSFSHVLAKTQKFFEKPNVMVNNPFASVYELNLLFNLILVIDSILFYKNPENGKYFYLAKQLLQESKINIDEKINKNHLLEINDKKRDNPDNVIQDLLNGNMSFSDGYKPKKLECDVYLSYCLRNYSAHNINALSIIWERFWEVQQRIMNVLFLAVETFY